MVFTFGLLSKSVVEELKKQGFDLHTADVDGNDMHWIMDALDRKVGHAKKGNSGYCLFVNIDKQNFVDVLVKRKYVDPQKIQKCLKKPKCKKISLDELEDEIPDEDSD